MTERLRQVLAEVEAQWVAMTSPEDVEKALHPPAAQADIGAAEEQLQHGIPSELRTFWEWHAGMRNPQLVPTHIQFAHPASCVESTVWWRNEADIALHAHRTDLDWSQAVYIGDLGGGAYYFAHPDGDRCRIICVDRDGDSFEGPDSLEEGFASFLAMLRSGDVWSRNERGMWQKDWDVHTRDEWRKSLNA